MQVFFLLRISHKDLHLLLLLILLLILLLLLRPDVQPRIHRWRDEWEVGEGSSGRRGWEERKKVTLERRSEWSGTLLDPLIVYYTPPPRHPSTNLVRPSEINGRGQIRSLLKSQGAEANELLCPKVN